MMQLLDGWLRHKSEMVNFEAAKAIADMRERLQDQGGRLFALVNAAIARRVRQPMVVSESDILDALALELLAQH